MINKKWCDPRNISILSRSCLPHLEHLSIICRPFYLPREFSAVIATAVYIPPQADTGLALSKLHEELSGYINKHPDAASIIAGDFNKANLRKVMPNFHQHVSCPTRGPNTLDHCYTQFKNAYKARSLPAFGKSDHAAIFLTPEYKQRIILESPGVREVTRWSSHSEAMLQASLYDVDWDMFRASSADVSEFTDVALSFVYMLTDQATETVTIRTFSNQKPWVDRTIRAAVNQRTAAYNAGLLSGNMSDYKASCYALRRAVRAAKLRYRERIESHFQLNDSRRMWQGLKTICSSGNNSSAEVSADPSLAEELNTFYGRFECNGGATLPISASGSSRQSSDVDHVITVSEDEVRRELRRVNVGAPQGCVLSPLLYSLYTHDCVSSHSSTSIVKFADDTVVLGLISNNDETAYLDEVERLTSWCQDNCLSLNVSKTKELIVDFRKRHLLPYTPLVISGTPVERVRSYKYHGVNISEDLTWTIHIQTQVKKARQRLYHLRQLRKFRVSPSILKTFYAGTIESVLTQCISVWYGNSSSQDCKALQRVVRLAERISGSALPSLQDIYIKRCRSRAVKITKDSNHPGNCLFTLLPSGKRFRCLMAKTERLRRSFFPQAIRLLNSN